MKPYSLLFFFFLIAFSITACTDDSEPSNSSTTSSTTTTTNNTNNGETSQIYILTVTYNWNAADHGALPNNAHFTTLFAVTHDDDYKLYATGQKASTGMESLAETGSTSQVKSEAEAIENLFNIGDAFTTGGGGPTATSTIEMSVSSVYPYLSFATMIAPSPDWFIGKSAILLYENNAFKDNLSGKMNAYDAGTEEGENFSLGNAATEPHANISLLTSMNGVTLDNENKPLATYTIKKK